MTLAAVSSFASNLAGQLGISAESQPPSDASQISSAEILSTAVSGIDFSGAEYGTLLLKDRIYNQGYGYSLVQIKSTELDELTVHLSNLKDTADRIAAADPADVMTYAALIEELDDREMTLSAFIGNHFHAADLSISAKFASSVGSGEYAEIVNIYDDAETKATLLGTIAAVEVDFKEIFASIHDESSCPHCISLNAAAGGTGMGTPETPHYTSNTSNTTGYVNSTATGNSSIDPLRMGEAWNVGAGDTLTYSFYDADLVPYDPAYNANTGTPGNPDAPENYDTDGAANEAAITTAFEAWDDTVSFSFGETEETGTDVGELRVAYTDRSSSAFAFAYGPGSGTVNGDIYFETEDVDIVGADDFDTTGLAEGGYAYYAALHEIGHAIGLSHPFDGTSVSGATLSTTLDNQRNSVMSYVTLDRNYVLDTALAGGVSTASTYKIFASTPMLLDIEIVEDLYGADTATNLGDNTYVFDSSSSGLTINLAANDATYGAPITLQTIVDSGGTDTIDLSSQTRDSTLNLSGGTMSSIGIYSKADQISDFAVSHSLSTATVEYYIDWLDAQASAANSYYTAVDRTALYTGEENLGIAHNADIENAIGGSGDDTIAGNNLANNIAGGSGDDTIDGNTGDDTITGGVGDDTIDGGAGTADIAVFSGPVANYTITTSGSTTTVTDNVTTDGTDTLTNIEYVEFSDGVFALPFTGVPEGSPPAQSDDATSTAQTGGAANGVSLSLADVDISTQEGALVAIGILDTALENISTQLATFGALTNRLKFSIAMNSRAAQQTELALGRTMDTDYAIEIANLVKAQILSQSANHVLAGSQMNKKTFLSLLQFS